MTRRQIAIAAWVGCLVVATASHARAIQSLTGAARGFDAASHQPHTNRLAQAAPAPPSASPPPPTAKTQVAIDPIGTVATLTGSATVTRNRSTTALKLQDDIFGNDILQTTAGATLGVTFNDATTFNLTANARIVIDSFVYSDSGGSNAALFNIAKGTVAFVAAAVAKTGDMTIATPTATLGIRGTTGLVEVPDAGAAAGQNNVAIKLYPDPDGKVGRIEVNGRDGARLGLLSQGATGFAITQGTGARLAAVPLRISPQQAARDRAIVRQVHDAQTLGGPMIARRRATLRGNPPRAPGLQRPAAPPPRLQKPARPTLPKPAPKRKYRLR